MGPEVAMQMSQKSVASGDERSHESAIQLASGALAPKVAQSLARHSDINLTMNVYTMVNVSDQAAAVESLPPLPGVPQMPVNERPRLRVTG
jgi:hypothetical protein